MGCPAIYMYVYRSTNYSLGTNSLKVKQKGYHLTKLHKQKQKLQRYERPLLARSQSNGSNNTMYHCQQMKHMKKFTGRIAGMVPKMHPDIAERIDTLVVDGALDAPVVQRALRTFVREHFKESPPDKTNRSYYPTHTDIPTTCTGRGMDYRSQSLINRTCRKKCKKRIKMINTFQAIHA